ncbi:MAG TPA: cytochrome b/b6 domain-containing protein [bacterium]|nr:cytochrome b/b6 domain-containing protein [bacterium]
MEERHARATSIRLRARGVVASAVGGIALLAALSWLIQRLLLWLAAREDTLGDAWAWVYFHLGPLTGMALATIVVLATMHRLRFGGKDARPLDRNDTVSWWSLTERVLHWVCLASFLVLLVTGVELYLAGPGLPSPLTRQMRTLHSADVFIASGGLLFLLWVRDALPRRYDLRWLRHLGGYLGYLAPLPAGRFNAGQKLWFWAATLTGITMAVSGLELQYRFSRMDDGYVTLLVLHLIAAAGFLCALTVHVYLAVLVVRGALPGMVHGRVGRAAALRLHSRADVPQPAVGSAAPAVSREHTP